MTKKEIAKAKDSELIVDYVLTYSKLVLNTNLKLGINRYSKHCADLECEMLKRKMLTEDDIKRLNT